MIAREIKSKVELVWNAFWNDGVSKPLNVMEQFSYLIFSKRLDDMHTLTGQPIQNPIFSPEQDHLRGSRLKHLDPQRIYDLPYTHLHHHGIDGLFADNEGDKLVEMIRCVNRNAEISVEQ